MSLGDLITLICAGVALWYVPRHLYKVYRKNPRNMSSADEYEYDENDVADVAATTATTQQQRIATPQTDSNALLLQAKAEALAALVKAGLVGETKGLQAVFGVRPSSTNPRYLAARDALKTELAKLDGPTYRKPDGGIESPSYPVSGRRVA